MHAVALRNKRRRTCSGPGAGPGAGAGAADAEARDLAEWRERYLLAHKLAPEERRRRRAEAPPVSAARYQPVPLVLLSRQVLMCVWCSFRCRRVFVVQLVGPPFAVVAGGIVNPCGSPSQSLLGAET